MTLQDGQQKVLYFVDVDDEFQENDEGPELDCIIHNITGSWRDGNGLPLYKIKSIELAKEPAERPDN